MGVSHLSTGSADFPGPAHLSKQDFSVQLELNAAWHAGDQDSAYTCISSPWLPEQPVLKSLKRVCGRQHRV